MANLEEKQRRAVSVVRIALDSQGIHGREVCANYVNKASLSERAENFAVFISAPVGADMEPYYETGKTLTEAVRKILATLKGGKRKDGIETTDDKPEAAPF